MKTFTLIATSLLALSQSYNVSGLTTTNFNASFDDLTPNPEQGPLSPVGVYHNISYTSFHFLQSDRINDGLIPDSSPNYAYGAGSATHPASMSVLYRHSRVHSFALKSLNYGCATIPPRGMASLPVRCSITAMGYHAGSVHPVAVQRFDFVPAGGWRAMLALGMFGSEWTELQRVTFGQSPARGTQFFLDDVVGSFES